MVDPNNPLYLVHNKDANGDGKLDPFLAVGPGDPEDFLWRDDWQSIINQMQGTGANTMYVIAVNYFNGVGDTKPGYNPFVSDTNPTIDPNKLDQIYTRVKALSDAGITTWFFIYDDQICVFGSCKTDPNIPSAEVNFINTLVNKLEGIPNLIWVVAEEYKDAFGTNTARLKNIAAAIKNADNNKHIVGVHHATGDLTFDFLNDPSIDEFTQQPSPNSVSDMHDDVLAAINSVAQANPKRHHVVQSEAFPYHENLLKNGNRTDLRRSNWAAAMLGVSSMVVGTWRFDRGDPAPSADMLKDWGRISDFMESTNFNEMIPNDSLAAGSTKWVLAKPGDSFILYTMAYSGNVGLTNMTAGTYTFKWLDTVNGNTSNPPPVSVGIGTQLWTKPSNIGNELVLYIKRTGGPTGTPIPTKPGDANGDGKVDGLDYIIWLNHYNQTVSGGASVGDFDNSGKVDGLDYVVWLTNYVNEG